MGETACQPTKDRQTVDRDSNNWYPQRYKTHDIVTMEIARKKSCEKSDIKSRKRIGSDFQYIVVASSSLISHTIINTTMVSIIKQMNKEKLQAGFEGRCMKKKKLEMKERCLGINL